MIRAASLRRTYILAIEQLALALALVFGGGILLLLLGTEILAWQWLALLAGTGAAIAVLRISRRRLTPYRVAQLLDRRLQLSDSLSTAWFLRSGASAREDALAHLQIARAEELATSLRLNAAFPFAGQRAWAMTGALAAVALGLFAVRYMVTNSLSLHRSLIPIHLQSVFERSQAAPSQQAHPAIRTSGNREDGTLSAPLEQERTRQDGASSARQSSGNNGGESVANSADAEKNQAQGNAKGQEGQSRNDGSQPNARGKAAESADQERASRESSKSQGQSKDGQEHSSGLMDKMKDALSSLMAKMRPNQTPPGPNSKESARNGDHANEDSKSGDLHSPGKGRKGQDQNSGNEQASQDRNSDAQAQGQTREKAQASAGKNSDESPANGSDAHSGVGRQDGDKNLKEAAQLQALGKLEEIIGKRSASLTGEMTVETPSNKQRLQTDYSQRMGRHSDAGGEINRDEIPLIDQQYVREYMEQVRKQDKGGH